MVYMRTGDAILIILLVGGKVDQIILRTVYSFHENGMMNITLGIKPLYIRKLKGYTRNNKETYNAI